MYPARATPATPWRPVGASGAMDRPYDGLLAGRPADGCGRVLVRAPPPPSSSSSVRPPDTGHSMFDIVPQRTSRVSAETSVGARLCVRHGAPVVGSFALNRARPTVARSIRIVVAVVVDVGNASLDPAGSRLRPSPRRVVQGWATVCDPSTRRERVGWRGAGSCTVVHARHRPPPSPARDDPRGSGPAGSVNASAGWGR